MHGAMARLARRVIPGRLRQVTRREARLMTTVFCDEEYRASLDLVVTGRRAAGAEVWAYQQTEAGHQALERRNQELGTVSPQPDVPAIPRNRFLAEAPAVRHHGRPGRGRTGWSACLRPLVTCGGGVGTCT